MKRRNLIVAAPGQLEIVDEELADIPDDGLLLRTLTSGLSAGTELTFLKGDNPALHQRLDAELGLFVPSEGYEETAYPVRRLGYMEVAEVVESRSAAYRPGEIVATPYGHASAHASDPVREHVVALPPELDPVLGVYAAHLGPICVNGLLHAAWDAAGPAVQSLGDGVDGRLVVVTGAGAIGLIVAMLARAHGAREVVVVEADERRRQIAEQLGFRTLDLAEDIGLALKTRWRHGPGDHGADIVFQCRGRTASLHAALRCLRPQGSVIDLAFYTTGAEDVRLGEEFHHNGLRVVTAQIGRVPRGLAHSWDRGRLSHETVRFLLSEGDDVRKHIITDVVPFDEAPQLMYDIAARKAHVLTAVFEFTSD
ncbi:zinc-binding dehydrogenase [Epidermidibacterium keratini]|uniref:Zinc-binding dehydrogenase n=1 Tax=Epidermidibacterium keratini TaxID=1891644 RepID=A0A7L4YLT6_9ACTN|nr:zinc-binding dehydrogenase [Epidermidibacterium keratini]QHC00038.1 zinc-binding dehydrogenase [Epidermidibacterium keratini]